MLIEFSVSNFKCIAETITFSMLAEKMLKDSNHLTISNNFSKSYLIGAYGGMPSIGGFDV